GVRGGGGGARRAGAASPGGGDIPSGARARQAELPATQAACQLQRNNRQPRAPKPPAALPGRGPGAASGGCEPRGAGRRPARVRGRAATCPTACHHPFPEDGPMPSRIEDYALIGDCPTAAHEGREGSIDWLCLPRFDSDACFAALLGAPEHGRWLLAPAGEVRAVRRRYRGDTLVLETEYETDGGTVTLTDCMVLATDTPVLVRVVEGKRGRVPLRTHLVIRFDYGSVVPWVRQVEGGLRAIAGPNALLLCTGAELHGEGL